MTEMKEGLKETLDNLQQECNKLYEEYEKREQMKSNLISIFLICCGSALFTWLMVY